jgi:hypothetical protein
MRLVAANIVPARAAGVDGLLGSVDEQELVRPSD